MGATAITCTAVERSLELIANADGVRSQERPLFGSVSTETTRLALSWLEKSASGGNERTTSCACSDPGSRAVQNIRFVGEAKFIKVIVGLAERRAYCPGWSK